MDNGPLQVLLVSTSYPSTDQDWRARFIADMVRSLSSQAGIRLKTWMPPGPLPEGVSDATLPQESAWLAELLAKGGIAQILRSKNPLVFPAVWGLLARLRQAYLRERTIDICHINWLQNSISLWGTDIPALITVLGTDYALLRLPGMVPLLRSVLGQRPCILAPNARWMEGLLKERLGQVARIQPIPFGVDKQWFAVQRDPRSPEQGDWLVVSRLTRAKIGPLFEWGKSWFQNGPTLHLFGPNVEDLRIPDWVRYHGPAHPADLLEQWFPRASGLISLSQHDEGRPQVILEAMAAGIPVVVSELPAHQDLIQTGETGWRVGSAEQFQTALAFLQDPEKNRQMGARARAWMREHIGTWEDCAGRYAAAYRDLVSGAIRPAFPRTGK